MSDAYTPAPAPVPKKSGSSALKIILIVLVVLVALGIGAVALVVGGIGYLAHKVVQKHADGTTTTHVLGTALSTANSSSFSPSDLGADIYPGSTPTDGGSKLDLPTGSITTGMYLTSDSVSKVADFYKGKFGASSSMFTTGDTAMLNHKASDKDSTTVSITNKPGQNGGKTKIAIMHTVSKVQ